MTYGKSYMKSQKGFTLVELMVVVAVLGVLAAIAIVNFVSMQERARVATVKANMHTTQLAVEDYNVNAFGNYPTIVIAFSPYLPHVSGGINGFMNPFTNVPELPIDGDPLATPGIITEGQIAYAYDFASPTRDSYTIFGWGKQDEGLLELQLGPYAFIQE